MAATHHERWDGKGYPYGLSGLQIPLPGRLMAIADVYDAIVSKRVYKSQMTHKQTVKIILESRGTQFDPKLVDVFEQIQDKFKEISVKQIAIT